MPWRLGLGPRLEIRDQLLHGLGLLARHDASNLRMAWNAGIQIDGLSLTLTCEVIASHPGIAARAMSETASKS